MEAPDRESDERWLAGLKLRPALAWAVVALRDLIFNGLKRLLAGRVGVGEADAEDYSQLAVLRVMDRLDSFNYRSRFSTWVMAVSIRVAMTQLRRRRFTEELNSDKPIESVATGGLEASCSSIEQAEELQRLRHAIQTVLTPRQRSAIVGELEGVPTSILAEQLGLTPNALYKLHHDARKKLRAALE